MQRKTVLKQMAKDTLKDLMPAVVFFLTVGAVSLPVHYFYVEDSMPYWATFAWCAWVSFLLVCFYNIGRIQYKMAEDRIRREHAKTIEELSK